MDTLSDSLLLQILSRLADSADVARCRVTSKAFNSVFPGLRSINIRCSAREWFRKSGPRVSMKQVFVDLISKLETVESVSIVLEHTFFVDDDDLDFAMAWLPVVSQSLKSLTVSGLPRGSHVHSLVFFYCQKLVNLKLVHADLSVNNLNPMPMLTSLTLESVDWFDQHLIKWNTCFPNLQDLKMVDVAGLTGPVIHLLNLHTCHLNVISYPPALTLIAPNLIALTVRCQTPNAVHVEAPMLSSFHLHLIAAGTFTAKKFNNLKTLWLDSRLLTSFLSEFPIIKTVENLTLDCSGYLTEDVLPDTKLSLAKVFMVFPNVTSLCINPGAWVALEAYRAGWDIMDGAKGLKTLRAYMMLGKPLLTFKYVASVLEQCVDLSEVSMLIHCDVSAAKSKSFMSVCKARWPGLKWRWGIWTHEDLEDYWISWSEDNEDFWLTY
ncbi:F-box/LRR-repeat protein At4g29420-like [Bidens hawaiensis]|uniref:F-box/LRR-repeat protein At4g29420-like n=1 Tax=Bidens hawaiensis TaxID=980011 RepID=UPI004048F14D